MAWTTPVTDRGADAYCTYVDMNRIEGNLNYIYPSASLPADYGQDDATTTTLVSVTRWSAILTALADICNALGFVDAQPTELMTYDNFNRVEELTLKCKDRLDMIQSNADAGQYAGESYYTGSEIYSQGA